MNAKPSRRRFPWKANSTGTFGSVPEARLGRACEGEQLLGVHREDVTGSSGSRPDGVVIEQCRIEERPNGVHVAQRWNPADGEPGDLSNLVDVRTIASISACGPRQSLGVDAVLATRKRENEFVIHTEDQRLDDLTYLTPNSGCCVGGGASAIGVLDDLDLEAIGSRRVDNCLLYTSPSPRDRTRSRMPSSA